MTFGREIDIILGLFSLCYIILYYFILLYKMFCQKCNIVRYANEKIVWRVSSTWKYLRPPSSSTRHSDLSLGRELRVSLRGTCRLRVENRCWVLSARGEH